MIWMRFWLFILLLLPLLLMGCKDVHTVTKEELASAASHWKEPKASFWYYMGNKEGYEHFVHYDIGNTAVYYRVTAAEMKMDNPMPLTSNRDKWRHMLWGADALGQEGS